MVRVAEVPRDAFLDLTASFPRLSRALWWNSLVEEAIQREWTVNLGQRDAIERMAHLLCELFTRHKAAGLVTDRTFEFPLTQHELGDAMGLSNVHVNRIMQELRSQGLIATPGRQMVILDWEGLKQLGEFDPTYLHQKPATEVA